jgi:hypothetical protein
VLNINFAFQKQSLLNNDASCGNVGYDFTFFENYWSTLNITKQFVTMIVLPSFVDSRIGLTQKLVDDMVDRLLGCP